MATATQTKTGIKNADELITLADAFGLTVTVESTDRETLTSYVVRISIPVPPAYAGTELGRTIAGDTLTLLWTKAHRPGARGRLEDATAWTVDSHRKVRTHQRITAHVHLMGHQSARYVRETAPQIEDVVETPHALFIDGERRGSKGLSADFIRGIVRNRRGCGRPIHQDADGSIVCETRRYTPMPSAPAEETPAPAEERMHVRIVDGGTPEIISTRDALAEINAAMMQPGKRAVREMSESRGHSRIVYKDPTRGTVDLRPLEKGQAPAAHEQRPTVQELVGPVDDALLASYAEMYAAVDEGTAIPVRADMVRPGMDVIAAVRLENRTVEIVTHYNGPGAPMVRVAWTMRDHSDSIMGDARAFTPDFHLMVTVDSLTRLYGSASAVRPAAEVLAATPSVEANSDRIRAQASREAYAWGVRHEAQQLGTNQVIEERARESLASVMHKEAGESKAGFAFRTNPRGVWLRGVTPEGDDWPLLTEVLRLHLDHYGWLTETSRSFGVSIVPPGDAGALVKEGQRRSVATAHAQALAEHAQR